MKASDAFDVLAAVGIVALVMMFVHPSSPGPRLVRDIATSWQGMAAAALGAVRTGTIRPSEVDPHPPGSVDDTAEARRGLSPAEAMRYCKTHPASDELLVEGTIRTCAAFQ